MLTFLFFRNKNYIELLSERVKHQCFIQPEIITAERKIFPVT